MSFTMLNFTLVEPTPLAKPRKLDGPTFASTITAEAPLVSQKKVPVSRRTVGIRKGEKLSRHSPGGTPASQDHDDQIENQDEYYSGDDDEDDQPSIDRRLKRARSTDSLDDEHKRAKVTGGRAVAFRQVTVDLDSDDEIIKTMKDQGIRDEIVQQRLIREGRVKYEIKTISTRYNRIRKAIEKHEDDLRELDFSDYHEDEDKALQEIAAGTSHWYQRALDDLNNRRARELVKGMKEKFGRAKYSKARCHTRLEALKDGTAIIPFEQDPDQEARRAATLEAIEARHAARQAAEEEAQHQLTVKKEKIEKTEQARAESRAKLEKSKAEKEAAAEATRIIREAEKAEREAKRLAATEKRKANAEAKKKAIEDNRRAAAQLKANKELIQQQKQEERERKKQEKKMETVRKAIEREEKRLRLLKTKEEAANLLRVEVAQKLLEKVKTTGTNLTSGTDQEVTIDSDVDDEAGPSNAPGTITAAETEEEKVKVEPGFVAKNRVTATTVVLSASPRMKLKVHALRELCGKRGLPVTGKKEELVARLMKKDESTKIPDLKKLCKERGLKVWGNKQVLMNRIARDDADKAT